MSKRKSIVVLVITLVLTALLAVMNFCSFKLPNFIANGIKDYNSIGSTIGLGIDLKGGYYAVLTPKLAEDGTDEENADLIDNAVEVLRNRLDNKGYTEATITIQGVAGSEEIRIEVPEIDDIDEFMQIIGSSGKLTFQDDAGYVYLTGSDVRNAYAAYDQNNNPIVVLEFTTEGTSKFHTATTKVLGSQLYIYLGDELISSPSVNEAINSSTAQIEGEFEFSECETLAAVIKAGMLPIDFEIGESNKVSASLGENALTASVIAGAIALLIIFAIIIIKYRGLGIAASIALTIYSLVFVVLLALVPWVQLTLPGIAGIILSIGMAVDANVIIFERINEEYKNGKTVVNAINAGFKRAFITILDSNVTTVLAAIVLLILCPGSIKGFAITLLIGIVLSMITSILVTRSYIKVLLPLTNNKAKFCNLNREAILDEELI
ncbi:MAG: protein translocase subunit SecD [Clostridia bacterium]|nr:protein translocase subunit SecD [Clostridia bacterium]